jgi:hypothetical protein
VFFEPGLHVRGVVVLELSQMACMSRQLSRLRPAFLGKCKNSLARWRGGARRCYVQVPSRER